MNTQSSQAPDQEYAKLIIRGKEYQFPIKSASVGYDVIDFRALLPETGLLSFDPGFKSTASCISQITYIDGEAGTLLHRGYDIRDLAQSRSYLEVCALLIHGELLEPAAQEVFEQKIHNHTMVTEDLREFYRGMNKKTSHPMGVMCTVTSALSSFYHEDLDPQSKEDQELTAIRLIAKMPTIAAMCYKHSMNQPFMYPKNSLSYVENFLHMMFATPCEDYQPCPIATSALEKIFILHADHEQNASTSTMRTAGSSGADPYTCVAAAIASLWGPAHGGANQAVLEMLQEIGHVENIPAFIAKAKDPKDPFRLMGFGHRVYKNFDPRAVILKESCDQVLGAKGISDPLLAVARELERIALEDPYFKQRKLYPNVDFYSGIILKALGIPVRMFTVIFAVARTVGWISHWIEMVRQPSNAIVRPRQLYQGYQQRKLPAKSAKKP